MRPDPDRLRCPDCARDGLAWPADEDAVRCPGCGTRWPVIDGFPKLYRDADLGRVDRLMRVIYDGLPALHDPMVRIALPLLQGWPETEAHVRRGFLDRLALDGLTPRADGAPRRILEVSVGTGANLPNLYAEAPDGPIEIWGLDYSIGMLRRCARRCRRRPLDATRLLLGDAHTLPFADDTFDRVFHVGAINGFADPGRALREMMRVARPGTPVVVVDEQLDPARRHGPLRRLGFRAVTFYDPAPACPSAAVPADAIDVEETQIARFFYCLRFWSPSSPSP